MNAAKNSALKNVVDIFQRRRRSLSDVFSRRFLRSLSESEEDVVDVFAFPLDADAVHRTTLGQRRLN
jgi:hypothetical protein